MVQIRDMANSQGLRIMHIGKYHPPHAGGMESYLGGLLRVQSAQGLEVTAVVHSSERSLWDKREQETDKDCGASYDVIKVARWLNIGFIPVSPLFLLAVRSAIKKYRPDILHLHHPNSSLMWLLLLKSARRLPWVSHWHSDILTPYSNLIVKLAYFFYRPVETALLKISNLVIATSPPYLKSSPQLQKFKNKAVVQPLGINFDKLPQQSTVEALQRPSKPVVLAVGRMAPYKAFDNLIRAVAMVPEIHCWLVGTGAEQKRLQQLARKLGVHGRLEFRGAPSNEQLWGYYQSADMFVLPSRERTEAFGVVLLEAAYFGLPIIATDIEGSGVPWVARQLNNCLLIRPDSAKEIALGIEKVLSAGTATTNETPKDHLQKFALVQQSANLTNLYHSLLSDT